MAKLQFDFQSPYGLGGMFYPGTPEFPNPPVDPGGGSDPNTAPISGGGSDPNTAPISGGDTTTVSATTSNNTPYTGDTFSFGFYLGVMIIAVVVAVVLLQLKLFKKR